MSLAVGSQGILALAGQYGFHNAAQFILEHIETLKQADNLLANRCGQVVEGVVTGFGTGADTGALLVGLSQALLGNPLTVGSVATAAINPIAMTCAAIGAVHYGWNALNDREREAILKLVSNAFNVGIELIRSIAHFALDLIRSLLSKENLDEIRKLVASVAATFGNTLSHVTRRLRDRASEAASAVSGTASYLTAAARNRLPSIRKKAN